jgi:type I restriction enzyme S subunit
LDKDYFFYRITQDLEALKSKSRGSTMKHITKKEFLGVKIPLPPSPEQHAIATTLRTVQEAKENTDAVIAAIKVLKAAMMKHLFTYGPVPSEGADKIALKETEIGPVPVGWEISTLGKIAHVGNGSTPKRDNPAYWENGTIPWITSTRVHDSIITRADFFVTELAARECHLPVVKKGSLVIAITGQGKTLGNTALVSFDTRVNQHLAYVKFNDDSVVAEFMLRFMQSRYQQLRDVSHSAGSTKGALTCGFLKTYPVPLPPNIVQTLIAETFSAIDQKLAAEQSRKEALDTLFASLLHNLMTAKIRVNSAEIG